MCVVVRKCVFMCGVCFLYRLLIWVCCTFLTQSGWIRDGVCVWIPFSRTLDSRSSVWSRARVLSPNEVSFLTHSSLYLHLSFNAHSLSTFRLPFLSPPLFILPLALPHSFTVSPQSLILFSSLFPPIIFYPSSTLTCNSSDIFASYFSSLLLTLSSAIYFPFSAWNLNNMKMNE